MNKHVIYIFESFHMFDDLIYYAIELKYTFSVKVFYSIFKFSILYFTNYKCFTLYFTNYNKLYIMTTLGLFSGGVTQWRF